MNISAINTSVSLALAQSTGTSNLEAKLLQGLGASGGVDQDPAGENDHDADDFSTQALTAGSTTPFRGNKVNTSA